MMVSNQHDSFQPGQDQQKSAEQHVDTGMKAIGRENCAEITEWLGGLRKHRDALNW